MPVQVGVNLTTFDTETELHKVALAHPTTSLLLRIRADDKAAIHCFGNKYGAEIDETAALLATARALNLNVVGVSFHVGSGASSPSAFPDAIRLARSVFDVGLALGFSMSILDIGGGFQGGKIEPDGAFNLAPVATAVNSALAQLFPSTSGVSVIAGIENPGALLHIMLDDSLHMLCTSDLGSYVIGLDPESKQVCTKQSQDSCICLSCHTHTLPAPMQSLEGSSMSSLVRWRAQ